jgi:hypothetical protein
MVEDGPDRLPTAQRQLPALTLESIEPPEEPWEMWTWPGRATTFARTIQLPDSSADVHFLDRGRVLQRISTGL